MSTIYVDTTKFREYVRELAKSADATRLSSTVKSEAASVMKVVAGWTRPAKKGDVRAQMYQRTISPYRETDTIFSVNKKRNIGRAWFSDRKGRGRGGRAWFLVGQYAVNGNRIGKQFAPSRLLMPADAFAKSVTFRKAAEANANARVKAALASIGLEQQSWLQIIQALGYTPQHPPSRAGVKAASLTARTRGGRSITTGTSTSTGSGTRFVATTANTLTIAAKAKANGRRGDAAKSGEAKVAGAIRVRQKAYEQAVKRGVLSDAKDRAARFPGSFSVAE